MIYLAYPVPSVRKYPIKDSYCWTRVGNRSLGRRYRYFYGSCAGVVTTRHCGIDIAAAKGSLIVAPYSGVVEHVNFGLALGAHQFLIRDAAGRRWYFAHTSSRPANGQKVSRGQSIARVGSESWYRGSDGKLHSYNIGAHLHFMVFTSDDYRHSSRNPFTYLEYARTHAA